MKPEQQRIAIAEACGWNSSPKKSNGKEPMGFASRFPEWFYPHHLPDYLNDLNEMHEAENSLSPIKQCQFAENLFQLMVGEHGVSIFMKIHATSAQRAESFLRTIGKWVEP